MFAFVLMIAMTALSCIFLQELILHGSSYYGGWRGFRCVVRCASIPIMLAFYACFWGSAALFCLCVLTLCVIISLILSQLRLNQNYSFYRWRISKVLLGGFLASLALGTATLLLLIAITTTTRYEVWSPHTYALVAADGRYVDQEGPSFSFYYADEQGYISKVNAWTNLRQSDDILLHLKKLSCDRCTPIVVMRQRQKISYCALTGETKGRMVGSIYELYIRNNDLSFQ